MTTGFKIQIVAILMCGVLTQLACISIPSESTEKVIQRQKEFDRHPNINSILIFPSTGDIDTEGNVTNTIQREIKKQLGEPSIGISIVEQIFSDWSISQLFPISLQPQLTFFDALLETNIESLEKKGVLRYPGSEYQYKKSADLGLIIRDLLRESKTMEPIAEATAKLDFITTKELLSNLPRVASKLTQLSHSAQALVNPRYMIFTKIKGTEQEYKNQTPTTLTAVIINFETGAIRSIGRVSSLTDYHYIPYLTQLRNLTAILISSMEKKGINLPDLY